MAAPEHKHTRFRQGREYHITHAAKNDYIEYFTPRVEALDNRAIYGRISRELDQARPVTISTELLIAMGYPDEGASLLCVSDPDDEDCNDPVFVQRNGNITSILRPDDYRERRALAKYKQVASDSTLGARIDLATLKRLTPSPTSTDRNSSEMKPSTVSNPPSVPQNGQMEPAPDDSPAASHATVTLLITSEQAVALFARLMREGRGSIGGAPICVDLVIRE